MRLAVALLSYRIGEQTWSSSFIGPRWRGTMAGSELRRRGLRRRGGSSERTAPLQLQKLQQSNDTIASASTTNYACCVGHLALGVPLH